MRHVKQFYIAGLLIHLNRVLNGLQMSSEEHGAQVSEVIHHAY